MREGADRDQVDSRLGDLPHVLKVDAAGGLELHAGAAARRDGLAKICGWHVVEQEPVGTGGERGDDLLEIPTLDLDREVGPCRPCGAHGLGETPGEGEVVLLDQDRVEEPETVIDATSCDDGLLLEAAQTRRGLSRIEDPRPGPGDCPDEARGQRRDTREVPEQIERRPLRSQQAGRRADREDDIRRHPVPPLALGDQVVDRVDTALPHGLGDRSEPEDHPGLLLDDPRPAARRLRYRRLRGHVAGSEVLGECPRD